jgi:uncharacterized protein YqeY
VVLKDTINNDLKTALLGGDHFKVDVLRGLKAVILDEEVTQNKREEGLDDTTIEQLIAREVKKRNESAVIYDGAGRGELAVNERREAEIMTAYLPAQMSEVEIEVIVRRIISEQGISNPAGMGQVIGAVKKELGNSADGAIIAKIVKNALN